MTTRTMVLGGGLWIVLAASAWAQATPAATPEFPGSALFNSHPPFLAGVKVGHPDLTYREGDRFSLEFTAERESYLYLLYHQADGASFLLFPNEAQRGNRMAAQRAVTIPAPAEAYRYRVRPPFGREVLQVLATLKPAPELDALVTKAGRAAPVSREVIARLHERLKTDPAGWSEHRVPITTLAKSAEPAPRPPARVGLFVGVNQQKVGKETWIRFKLGAELISKVLVERGGVDPQRARLLTGSDATRPNVEQAITRWLPSVTQPGDTVFIFYGGHGGTVKDLDGVKPDGRDGILTTYDNDFEQQRLSSEEWEAHCRQSYITDKALARWLQELNGRQVVVLISSCYSGSMAESRALASFLTREAARVKGISQLNVALITSSMPDETTLSPLNKPVWLAGYLAEAMTKLPAPVTLPQAFDYYRQQHHERLEKTGDAGWHEPVFINNAVLPIVLAP